MSQSLVVFVPWMRSIPTCHAWSAAAAAAGITLETAPFDTARHKGGVSVVCDGIKASFEYFRDPIIAYAIHADGLSFWERLRLLRFQSAIELVTHARVDDRFAAISAGAVLAAAVRGVLLDCESGQYVRGEEAVAWARVVAPPPMPGELQRRLEALSAATGAAEPIFSALGYSVLSPPPEGAADTDRWFSRPGAHFRHELVEVSVYADGDESFLSVTFFGTPQPLERLQANGWAGLALGTYLWQVPLPSIESRGQTRLPQNIPVDSGFPTSQACRQLESELLAADAVVFQDLLEDIRRHPDRYPAATRPGNAV